ncbi:MAG TPA: glucose 1-dehydrogenase [Chloroflexota bacterium]|nr:glucose 1-dehydrogenase [Chloroflexota bacterium]
MDLSGKVAIITGGGTGLGRGMSLGFARAGAAVAVAGIDDRSVDDTVAELGQAGHRAIGLHADVRDRGQVEEMARRVAAELGGIDILVNNAAIYPRRAWTEIAEEEWDEVFRVNIKGYFLCARAVYPYMQKRGGGRIINISSITTFIGFANLLDYVSTKGAIVGFTRSLAREVGAENITVNSIAPGAFPTAAEEIHPNREEMVRGILEQQAIKRRGRPEDIANAALFFASPDSGFVTGQTLLVDGGWYMN